MQRLRLIRFGLTMLVALVSGGALGQDAPGVRLTGWTYAVSAPLLDGAYVDPGGRLNDGKPGRDLTAIWQAETVTIQIALPQAAKVSAVRVYRHHHNLNCQLSFLGVRCQVGGQDQERRFPSRTEKALREILADELARARITPSFPVTVH